LLCSVTEDLSKEWNEKAQGLLANYKRTYNMQNVYKPIQPASVDLI